MRGAGLYPGPDEFVVNNYPPLSFYIVGLVSELTGDAIYAGRLVSLTSTGAAAAAIALCIRALGGLRSTAAFGSLWFLATAAYFFPRYVGVNDPNLLGLAAMGLALALFLSRFWKGGSTGLPIACMVLAGFIKHSLIAIPVSAVLWLLLKDWRAGLRALLLSSVLSAIGLLLCLSIYGPNFFQQMLMPREITFSHIAKNAGKIQYIAPAMAIWAYYAWTNRRSQAAQFTALLMGASLISDLVQSMGAGLSINSHFEVLFAAGVGMALAFERIGDTPIAKRFSAAKVQAAMLGVLVLRLLLGQDLEPYLVLASSAFRQEVRLKEAAMEAEVARIRSIPGAVSCSAMIVCYWAGKAFVYDDFWVGQKIATGKLKAEEERRLVQDRDIRFEMIDEKAMLGKKRLF